MKYTDYRPAGGIGRFLALFVNLVLYAIASSLIMKVSEASGFNRLESNIFMSLGTVFLIIIFCVYPETPGKRLGQLRILNEQKEEIDLKKRIIRVSPYLAFTALMPLAEILPSPTEENTTSVVWIGMPFLLIPLFILCDGLTVFFHPEKRSLMDIRLGTTVMKPPPLPEHLKPKFFGRKII